MATPTFIGAGTNGTGSTPITPGFPSPAARDYCYLAITTRSGGTIVAPGGVWTELIAPFTGSSGMTSALYYTVATGGEGTGTVSCTITSADSSCAKILAYRSSTGWMDHVTGTAADTTSTTDYTATSGTMAAVNGDMLLSFTGISDDGTFSARSLLHSGATEGTFTNRFSFVNATGLDSHLEGSDVPLTSTASGTVTFSETSSTAVTGSSLFVLLREVAVPPILVMPPRN